MTDLQDFRRMFDKVGQAYSVDASEEGFKVKLPAMDVTYEGYPGFYAEFLFDSEGKYITYAAWE